MVEIESHQPHNISGMLSAANVDITQVPPSPSPEEGAVKKPIHLASNNHAHSGTVGRRPRMKPENDLGDPDFGDPDLGDPPVFMVLGLPFVGIGRGADLAEVEGLVGDGPAGRLVCRCLSRGPSDCQSIPCCFFS